MRFLFILHPNKLGFPEQQIETLEDIQSESTNRSIASGTVGMIVEVYQNPECYAIDLAIPDEALMGNLRLCASAVKEFDR